ncbi:MAG: 3-phosphoshikimate 1-carboxyvinyltransferase [Spirochaetales bacterium]|nr:3-phosphoshikimate 1-carboxyvinyltransferase [Spirochaetales bacterium]
MNMQEQVLIKKIRNMKARASAPPSKAHSLRAIALASLAGGTSRINNPLLGDDQLHLIECMRRLGVGIDVEAGGLTIRGAGGCFSVAEPVLDAGESGVSMNFLCALGVFADREFTLTGAPGLLERPVDQVVDGVRQLGGRVDYLEREGYPPVKIHPGGLKGGTARIRGSRTSQYFSSLALAAPLASEDVTLLCTDTMTERPYFDITADMMSRFGATLENDSHTRIRIPRGRYTARDYQVEGDYSSASFFFLAAAVCGAEVTVDNLSESSVQGDKAFPAILEQMGCELVAGGGKVTVKGRPLSALELNMADVPDLVPCAAVACAYARGTSTLTGVGHLRNKECDRLEALREGLSAMGAECGYDQDSLWVKGTAALHAAEINPYNDHRIAMSFAVAGLPLGGQVIRDRHCVKKSFPDFWERFEVFYHQG